MRHRWAKAVAGYGGLACALWLAAGCSPAGATVFYARDEALRLAFPGAERVEARDFFLTPEQRSDIEHGAKAPLDSNLVTLYAGFSGEAAVGYALLDTHVVRTLPETLLIVLSPDGEVRAVHLLAFYEPMEYAPAERWVGQVIGKRTSDDLDVGRGVAAITGSTLTSRAVMAGVRRALAIHAALLGGR